MQGRTLAEIVLRLLGAWLIVASLATAPHALVFMWNLRTVQGDASYDQTRLALASTILQILVQLALGVLLMVWARTIARRIVPETQPLGISASASELQSLAFGLVGVYFLIVGLRGLALVVYATLSRSTDAGVGPFSYLAANQGENLVSSLVELAAGILMLFGRRGIAEAWQRFRASRARL